MVVAQEVFINAGLYIWSMDFIRFCCGRLALIAADFVYSLFISLLPALPYSENYVIAAGSRIIKQILNTKTEKNETHKNIFACSLHFVCK